MQVWPVPTCAARGSLLDKVAQLAVTDEGALRVFTLAVQADIRVEITFIHIWKRKSTCLEHHKNHGMTLGQLAASLPPSKETRDTALAHPPLSSPIQVFMSRDAMKPSKQRQRYSPGMLVHCPPSQMSGLSSHSSISKERGDCCQSKDIRGSETVLWEQEGVTGGALLQITSLFISFLLLIYLIPT